MDYATLAQGREVAGLMVDQKVLREYMTHLLSNGLLADLLGAGGSVPGARIARKTFQRFLGVRDPEMDAGLPLSHPKKTSLLLKRVSHDPDINDQNFPYRRRDTTFMEIVGFPGDVTIPQAVMLAGQWWDLTPPCYEEAFAWAYALDGDLRRLTDPVEMIVFPHKPVAVGGCSLVVAFKRDIMCLVLAETIISRSCHFVFVQERIVHGD